jgi:hypothetical protein
MTEFRLTLHKPGKITTLNKQRTNSQQGVFVNQFI